MPLISRKAVFYIKTLLAFSSALLAQQSGAESARCSEWAAQLVSVEGAVSWRADADAPWQPARLEDYFCYGDSLRVERERAALRLANDTLVRLNENSLVNLLPERQSFWLELLQGAGHFLSRTPKDFTVKAPYLNAAVDGTEFVVTEGANQNRVGVIEGTVIVSNARGTLRLDAGESAAAGAGSAPLSAPRVRLRQAAEWTLYFPPLVVHTVDAGPVKDLIDKGDYREAYRQLQDDGSAGVLSAALALSLGRANDAQAWLETDVDQSPEAQAVRALADLLRGDAPSALDRTAPLVAGHPGNLSALVAHSYALQGTGEIGKALATVEQAHIVAPDNLFVQVRLAALHLSHGNAGRARDLIEQALALGDSNSRVHTIAGFIDLNHSDVRPALAHFAKAVELDSGDPLAHWGKALALWQEGETGDARRALELAVLLDPANSTLRSYLGQVYAETFQAEWAMTQYDLAQKLDVNDPTPWLFNADLLQQQNRVPEALQSLETAMQKNNNRAVFRTRALLKSDAAAQSANQARIYQSLRLEEKAQSVAALATSQSPADFASHYALALAYATEPEAEVLRADEALQAKLLQPVSANALNVGTGQTGIQAFAWLSPSRMGLHEYRSLFDRRGLSGYISPIAGTQATLGYEWQLQLNDKRAAFNAGQYSQESDGFRDNNGLDVQLSEMAFHLQASKHLKLFMEHSRRDEHYGDLASGINSPFFRTTLSHGQHLQINSFGAAYNLSSQRKLLLHSGRADSDLYTTPSSQLGRVVSDGEHKKHELAYIQQDDLFNWQLGYAHEDFASTMSFDLTLPFPPYTVTQTTVEETLWRHLYLDFVTTDSQPWRLAAGVATTDIEGIEQDATEDRREQDFRLGLRLEPRADLGITLARWRTFAERLPRFGRLAPTHLFDVNTRANLSAFSINDSEAAKLTWNPGAFTLIAQAQESEYQEPTIHTENNSLVAHFPIERRDLDLNLSYLVNDRISLYSKWTDRTQNNAFGYLSHSVPAEVDLQIGGVGASVFVNSFFSVGTEILWAKQTERCNFGTDATPQFRQHQEEAPLLNASLDLRLPRRLGYLTIEGYNLLDEPFSVNTSPIQLTSESTIPSAPAFAPGRSVLAKLTLNF